MGSVGDKVEGAPVYTQHSKQYENELPNTLILVGGLSCLMIDTFPSKMDCELFQE